MLRFPALITLIQSRAHEEHRTINHAQGQPDNCITAEEIFIRFILKLSGNGWFALSISMKSAHLQVVV
jgi:hypothetical protein